MFVIIFFFESVSIWGSEIVVRIFWFSQTSTWKRMMDFDPYEHHCKRTFLMMPHINTVFCSQCSLHSNRNMHNICLHTHAIDGWRWWHCHKCLFKALFFCVFNFCSSLSHPCHFYSREKGLNVLNSLHWENVYGDVRWPHFNWDDNRLFYSAYIICGT